MRIPKKLEKWYFTAASKLFSSVTSNLKNIYYWLWGIRHPEKRKGLLKLQKQVLNELASFSVELPTEFHVTMYEQTAWYCESADKILFPLGYMHANMRKIHSAVHDLRHEYGHAAIWHVYEKVGPKEFAKLFGSLWFPYEDHLFICYQYRRLDKRNYLSKYAQVHPAEDFAECFAHYLKYKGDIARYKDRPGVYEKMKFVEKVVKCLQKRYPTS